MVTFGSCSDGKGGAGALEFPFCGQGADRAAATAVLAASPQTQPVCVMKAEMEESTGTPPSPRSHPHPPHPPVPLGQCELEVSTLFTLISRRALREISPLCY